MQERPAGHDHAGAADPADRPTPVWRVTLAGPLDLASAPTVERTFADALDAGATHLLVDVGDVDFMDSTGLRTILSARVTAEERGGALILERCSPAVEQVLEVSALLSGLTSPPPSPPGR